MFGIDPLGHIGYWAATVVIAVTCVALYQATMVARQANVREMRSVQVVIEVSGLAEAFSRARAAQRGFLLEGKNFFLERRDTELAIAKHHLAAICLLYTSDAADE